jgi:eukaryotic-like serine/threonine-protein kinase
VIVRITGNAGPVDGRQVDEIAVLGGRYELGALLGTGASAVVRRASDRLSGRTFAVKLFHAGASEHDRRRQQREMEALAALHHPGLVGLHDGGVEDGRPYIVTDLVEGPSLAERLAERPLSAGEVRRVGARLADALAHVHASGIVHRDLKPANVLLGSDGRPRLADFGIARALDGTAVTGTGFVVGTAAYLAPEQVRGEFVGPEADVYALGLVLLECLTGRREYPGALVESATARLHRPPDIPGKLPTAMRTTLLAMTALEPAARPTAAEVASLLGAGSRFDRAGGYGRGVHRRATTPRTAGLAAALAVAAVTAAALPSSAPVVADERLVAGPGVVTGTVPWPTPTAVVPVDRVAAALGHGVDVARRTAALHHSFDLSAGRPAVTPKPSRKTADRPAHRTGDRPHR